MKNLCIIHRLRGSELISDLFNIFSTAYKLKHIIRVIFRALDLFEPNEQTNGRTDGHCDSLGSCRSQKVTLWIIELLRETLKTPFLWQMAQLEGKWSFSSVLPILKIVTSVFHFQGDKICFLVEAPLSSRQKKHTYILTTIWKGMKG